ncbi:SIR2-like protein [Hoeflea halophila]|uniref:SIR2-like protein n=1 Tax=Hoeflea halophila TaxID=714899 RepID=A0A286HRN0_9HYPH|nr:SIR2 family protein [Hoeflea halophila]SOE10483.1 SIR2-like protein [Hoeflea halophila]
MIDWPDEVIDSISRRRSVIFIGSGISANSQGVNGARPPTWKSFLERALQRCSNPKAHISRHLKSGDYLSACDLLKERLDEAWDPFLRECFVAPMYRHAEIHKSIFELDSRIVITPNFDKIYDRYAINSSGGTVSVKNYTDQDLVSVIRSDLRFIFKIHGDIDSPGNLIFTRKQYAKSRIDNPNIGKILDALLTSHCFLFLGSGLSDPDMALLMEDQNFLHRSGAPHYMVLPKPIHQEEIRLIRDTRNIKILTYNKKNNHEELLISVNNLVN